MQALVDEVRWNLILVRTARTKGTAIAKVLIFPTSRV
jgi:hypothetical protein